MYNSSKNKLSTIYLFEEQDTSEGAEWFHIDGQGGYSPLNYLHLIFEKSSLINLIFFSSLSFAVYVARKNGV